MRIGSLIIGLSILLFTIACDKEVDNSDPKAYNGPLMELDSVETLYSDSAVVRIKVKAPKQMEFESGNREFPNGIYIEFYEPTGKISSTLKADKGYYLKEDDRYTAVGNIFINNLKEDSKLFTDTLHWAKPDQKIFTKANVTITEGLDTLRGVGLEAAQDFSTYEILKPVGTTYLDDEEEEEK